MLKYLSNDELLKFEKFVSSPYFNSSAKLIVLFNILKDNKDDNISKEKIFSLLYPGVKYNDARLRKLLSDFYKLYEKFLGYYGIEKWDPFSVNTYMLELMQEKGMSEEFSTAYKQVSKKLSSDFFKEDPFYRSFSRIEHLQYYAVYNKTNDPSPAGLEKASFNMDMQFVYTKLHLLRDILLHNIHNKDKYTAKIKFYDEVLQFVRDNITIIKRSHPNLYIIYLTVMASIEESNSAYIKDLAGYIKYNEKKFDKSRLSYYYSYLTSYYWNKINKGEIDFYHMLMRTYKYMDRKGIMKSERYLPHHFFNSIVMAAISVNDHAWLEKFIEKYKGDIEPEYFNDVYNINLAKLHFLKGDYSLSLKYLNSIEYKDPNYFINAKTMLLKTLYEQGDFDGMKYTLDSLKHYIYRNNKLVAQQVHNVKMVIRFFKYLLKIKDKDDLALHKFLEDLGRERSFVPQRVWLIEKVSQMSKSPEFNPLA